MKRSYIILLVVLLVPILPVMSQIANLSPTSLDERNLRDVDGDTLRLTLTDATFDDPLGAVSRYGLSNNISNMLTPESVIRIDEYNVDLVVKLSGNIDSNTSDIYVDIDHREVSGSENIETDNSFAVVAYDEPTANVSGGGVICDAGSEDITITFTGHKPFRYNYEIDGNPQTELTVYSMDTTITFTTGVTYHLTSVYDTNDVEGAIGTATATITIETTPSPSISGLADVCGNTQHTYQTADVSGNSYDWSQSGGSFETPDGSNSREVLWGTGSSGWVTVTESTPGGCSATTGQYAVTLKALPATPSISGDGGYCPGSDVTITSSVGNSYEWSTAETTQAITVNSADDYWVKITDAEGCWSLQSAIKEIVAFTIPFDGDLDRSGNNNICEGVTTQIEIEVKGNKTNWSAKYTDDHGDTLTLSNITGPSYEIDVTPITDGRTYYYLIDLWNENCPGVITDDNTWVDVIASPKISFTSARDEFSTTEDTYQFQATPSGDTRWWSCSASSAITSSGLFDPSKADTCVSCNIVSYTVIKDGCQSTKDTAVTVYVARGDYIAPNSYNNNTENGKYIYCYDAPVDEIRVENLTIPPGHILYQGFWSGPVTPLTNTTASFNPQVAGDGLHQIQFSYYTFDGLILYYNVLPAETFVVDYVGLQTIYGLLPAYCLNAL